MENLIFHYKTVHNHSGGGFDDRIEQTFFPAPSSVSSGKSYAPSVRLLRQDQDLTWSKRIPSSRFRCSCESEDTSRPGQYPATTEIQAFQKTDSAAQLRKEWQALSEIGHRIRRRLPTDYQTEQINVASSPSNYCKTWIRKKCSRAEISDGFFEQPSYPTQRQLEVKFDERKSLVDGYLRRGRPSKFKDSR